MLPQRAVITFSDADLRKMTNWKGSTAVQAWVPFRALHHLTGTRTIVTRSSFGGPNVAALVEELCAFGVREFVLWGYCGGIAKDSRIGDLYLARGAIREDGISHHYLEDEGDYVSSNWIGDWMSAGEAEGFRVADIWSIDAIYRETEGKIEAYSGARHRGGGDGGGLTLRRLPCQRVESHCLSRCFRPVLRRRVGGRFPRKAFQGGC